MIRLIKKCFGIAETGIKDNLNKNLFSKLITNSNGYSVKNFFLLAVTIMSLLLMIPIPIAILIEVSYNHTIATDFGGMAAYITAIAGLMAAGGITKAWSEWSENKYTGRRSEDQESPTQCTYEEDEEIIDE